MFLLDVNSLVALAWDSHIHHVAVSRWFDENPDELWATCPITESGFVRVSANAQVLEHNVTPSIAREVLRVLRTDRAHRFLADDVSPTDTDFPDAVGYRQVTDAHLVTLARRNHSQLLTFDSGAAALDVDAVVLLRAL